MKMMDGATVCALAEKCITAEKTCFFSQLLFSLSFPLCPAVLECEGLQHLFLNKLREVAASWRQQLPAAQRASTRFSRCCVHAIRNTRRKMEDRHVTVADFNRLLGIQVMDCRQKFHPLFPQCGPSSSAQDWDAIWGSVMLDQDTVF